MRLLPQPGLPGRADGIISEDPLTLQCGVCGELLVNTEGRRPAMFIILSGYLFCTLEHGEGPRRCPECRAEHRKTCRRCE
jgi:hypothetical protein